MGYPVPRKRVHVLAPWPWGHSDPWGKFRTHSVMDKGSEFIDARVQKFLKDRDITYDYADTDDKHKMGMIERFNRTIRGYFQKYFTLRNTFKWIEVIEDIEYNYNHTVHSTLRKAPIEMTVKMCTLFACQDQHQK
jgi:IS30 family transposase